MYSAEQLLNCSNVKSLCPNREYFLTCSFNQTYDYKVLKIHNSKCKKNAQTIELDIFASKNTKCEIGKKCGAICVEGYAESDAIVLNFTASKYLDKAEIRCLGQSPDGHVLSEPCRISLAGSKVFTFCASMYSHYFFYNYI